MNNRASFMPRLPSIILLCLCVVACTSSERSSLDPAITLYEPLQFKHKTFTDILSIDEARRLTEMDWTFVYTPDDAQRMIGANVSNCRDYWSIIPEDGSGATSSSAIRTEHYMQKFCERLRSLSKVSPSHRDFVGQPLVSGAFLTRLPSSLLPEPGGIYNEDGWNRTLEHYRELRARAPTLHELLDTFTVSENKITGTLSAQRTLGTCDRQIQLSPVAKGDFNGDGLADLIVSVGSTSDCDGGSLGELGAFTDVYLTAHSFDKPLSNMVIATEE